MSAAGSRIDVSQLPGARGVWVMLMALLAVPLAGRTQSAESSSDEAVEPFLGTWSGVFTTQDDEFWGIEDFVCFPGCAQDVYDYIIGLLDDPANDDVPVGALMGQTAGYAAEHLSSMLTEQGLRIQQENLPETDAKLHCQPYGYVRQVTNPLPMVIRRNGDHLLIEYEEWSLLRTIYMDGRPHPEHRTPTLLGHSVGRIENGVLIVETARVTPGWISDYTRGGYTGELTGVERYTVLDDPRRLELELTIEDPVILKEPYVVTKTWLSTPDVELLQDSCGDLPGIF